MPTLDFTLNSGECGTLFYEHRNPGAEDTLLFLHGLGTTHESWIHQLDYFQQRGFQVLAPDIPGFGASKLTFGHFSINLVTDCIQALLNQHQIKKTIIVGHSMGGPLTMQCCMANPERFEKAIFSNSFAHIRLTSFSSAFAYIKRFILANLQDADRQAAFIAHKTFPGDQDQALREMFQQQIVQTDKTVYKDAVNLLAHIDLRKALHAIQFPCLVLAGLEDQTIPPVLQHELMRYLPNAIEVCVQHGRHGMIFSQAALINTVIWDFIQQ